jgi:hypothetical protein
MKPTICLVIFTVLLISCGSAADATEASQPSPLPSTPTPKPTLVPLSDLDLEPVLVFLGDLPAGYDPAQVRSSLPGMFDGIPQPINQIYQQFEHENDSAGGTAIIVYDAQQAANMAYTYILDGMTDSEDVQTIGEQGRLAILDLTSMGGIVSTELLFLRCNTVVHIRMTGTSNPDYVTSYAQRLDERLTGLVCR